MAPAELNPGPNPLLVRRASEPGGHFSPFGGLDLRPSFLRGLDHELAPPRLFSSQSVFPSMRPVQTAGLPTTSTSFFPPLTVQ